MSIPGDIWVFAWIKANPLSTEWADEDSDILHICIWTLVCCITSVLKTKDVVAAVAGEGEEVDLVAVADAAVLPQVGELRRAHTSGGARSAPSGRAEPVTASAAAASAREMLPAPRHRQAGREGRRKSRAGGSVVKRTGH